MNVNGPNPASAAAPEPQVAPKRVAPVPADPAVPRDRVAQKPLNASNTSVLVEMERNNTLVYKFIDETTGKVFQQFPPEQMLQQGQAELPDLSGKKPGPKEA